MNQLEEFKLIQGLNQNIKYKYTSSTCHYDPKMIQMADDYFKKLSSIHEELFESNEAQTFFEIQLSKLVMYYINTNNHSCLYDLMTHITNILEEEKEKVKTSSHTIKILRQNFMHIGLYLLESGRNQSQVDDLLTSDHISKPYIDILKFVLDCVIRAGGLFWASSLLTPTIDEAYQIDFIYKTIILNSPKSEYEYISSILQIPWSTLTDDEKYEPFLKSALSSFKKVIEKAVKEHYIILISLIGKISAFLCRKFPQYIVSVIEMLMKSTWPSKLINIPNLVLFKWDYLDDASLFKVFEILYHLNMPVEDYASQSLELKIQHRNSFANYHLSNFPIVESVYRFDPQLKSINDNLNFPIFRSIINLVHYFNLIQNRTKFFHLSRFIIEEIYYYAAIWSPDKTLDKLTYDYQSALKPKMISELLLHIRKVTESNPKLFNIILTQTTLYPKTFCFDLESLIPLNQIIIDDVMMDWFAYVLIQKVFPSSDTPLSELYSKIIDKKNIHISQNIIHIAKKSFLSIQWESLNEILRFKGLIILLESRGKIEDSWRAQVSLNFELNNVFHGFQQVILDQLFQHQTDDILSMYAIISVASYMLMNEPKDDQLTQTKTYNFEWFTSYLYHFYTSLYNHSKNDFNKASIITKQIIKKMIHLIAHVYHKLDAKNGFSSINNILDLSNYLCLNSKEILMDLMKETLDKSLPREVMVKWFTFWINILLPRINISMKSSKETDPNYKWCDDILNDFLHAAYFEGIDLKHVVLNDITVKPENINNLISQNHYWTLFYVLKFIRPLFIDVSLNKGQQDIQTTSLWLFSNAAIKINDPIMACLFFEQFYKFYFDAMEHIHIESIIDSNTKHILMKKIEENYKICESNSQYALFAIVYKNFMSWDRSLIFGNGYTLLEHNQSSLFKAFTHIYTPLYPVNKTNYQKQFKVEYTKTLLKTKTETKYQTKLKYHHYKTYDSVKVISIEDIISLIPKGYTLSRDLFDSDLQRYNHYMNELNLLLNHLLKGDVKIISTEILSMLSRVEILSNELIDLNNKYLLLQRQLWKEELKESDAILPKDFKLLNIKDSKFHHKIVVPGYDLVKEDIEVNRMAYNDKHYELFSISRGLARFICYLNDILTHISTSLELKSHSRNICLSIFFELLPLVMDGSLRKDRIVYHSIINLLKRIGDLYFESSTNEEQMRLLTIFLQNSMDSQYFNNQKDQYIIESLCGGVIPSTEILLRFFSPKMFYKDNNCYQYFELMNYILSSYHGLSIREEDILLDQFDLDNIKVNGYLAVKDIIYNILNQSILKQKLKVFSQVIRSILRSNEPVHIEFMKSIVYMVMNSNCSEDFIGSWAFFINDDDIASHEFISHVIQILPIKDSRIPIYINLLERIMRSNTYFDESLLKHVSESISKTINLSVNSLKLFISFIKRNIKNEEIRDHIFSHILNPIIQSNDQFKSLQSEISSSSSYYQYNQTKLENIEF